MRKCQKPATVAYPCQPVLQEWGCQQESSPKIWLDTATLVFPEIFQNPHTTGKKDFTSHRSATKSKVASLNKLFELTLKKKSVIGRKGTVSGWNYSKSPCRWSTNTWIAICTGKHGLKLWNLWNQLSGAYFSSAGSVAEGYQRCCSQL